MIHQYLNYILIAILLMIVIWQFVKKPIKRWKIKRANKKRKKQQLQQLNANQKKFLEGIQSVAEFFNWVDSKVFTNSRQKKQFYRDFHRKEYRTSWFNNLMKQLESNAKATEVKLKGAEVIEKPKVEEKKNENK